MPPQTAAPIAPAAAPAAPATPSATGELPGGIEIFRAGTHRDDMGRTHTFGAEALAEMAASYNRALREAPLTVGHPKDNLPAYGWVGRVYVNEAGNLAIDPVQVDPAFAEMVRAGRFKKRSASFYPPNAPHNPTPGKWYLRHVGFLGAQPPAVPGLADIEFSADDTAQAVSFAADISQPAPGVVPPPKEPTMSDADKTELERLRAQNQQLQTEKDAAEQAAAAAKAKADEATAQAQSYAEQAAADRRASFVSFADAEIKAGRLMPKDKQLAVATLEALATTEAPVSFSEGGTTTEITAMQMCAWLQGQMSSRAPVIQFGEIAGGAGTPSFDARGKTDAEIDAAARAYQREHPEVNYSEALVKVTSFTD